LSCGAVAERWLIGPWDGRLPEDSGVPVADVLKEGAGTFIRRSVRRKTVQGALRLVFDHDSIPAAW